MIVKIRREEKGDYGAVYDLVKAAFATAEHSDGNEQDLIVKLRKSDNFIPELSLVAEKDGKVVGHIMFTKVKIGDSKEIALAPLAVHPDYQGNGIGGTLVEEGHRIAKDLGYHFSVVLGSATYYPKFGYEVAKQYGIEAPFEVNEANYMIKKLNDTNEKIEGVVKYAEAFGL